MRKLKLFVSFSVLLLGGKLPAPDGVGNGGIGEKNLLFAFLNMKPAIESCLSNIKCEVNASEKELLQKIKQLLEVVPPSSEQIIFKSEKGEPGTFTVDGRAHGQMKSAKTELKAKGSIWINSDHLYRELETGQTEAIDIPSAASLLLDEVAHQVEPLFNDPVKHMALDLLCAKFKAFLMLQVHTIDWRPETTEIGATIFHTHAKPSIDQLFLFDFEKQVDLTKRLHQAAACDSNYKLVGLQIENPHWHAKEFKYVGPFLWEAEVNLHAWAMVRCVLNDKDFPVYTVEQKQLVVTFTITRQGRSLFDKRRSAFRWALEVPQENEPSPNFLKIEHVLPASVPSCQTVPFHKSRE